MPRKVASIPDRAALRRAADPPEYLLEKYLDGSVWEFTSSDDFPNGKATTFSGKLKAERSRYWPDKIVDIEVRRWSNRGEKNDVRVYVQYRGEREVGN